MEVNAFNVDQSALFDVSVWHGAQCMACRSTYGLAVNIMINLPSTRGDQKVHGKVLLNRIAFIDCNENSQI